MKAHDSITALKLLAVMCLIAVAIVISNCSVHGFNF